MYIVYLQPWLYTAAEFPEILYFALLTPVFKANELTMTFKNQDGILKAILRNTKQRSIENSWLETSVVVRDMLQQWPGTYTSHPLSSTIE